MKRRIKKVAVLGSGVMGSGIACHFANIGAEVLLIDIVPRELDDKEKVKGLTLEDKVVRNRIVNNSLTASLKSKPSPIYKQSFSKKITTGNFDDDLSKIADCDWVIEVVIESLDIKQSVFENVEDFLFDLLLPVDFKPAAVPHEFQITFNLFHFQPVRMYPESIPVFRLGKCV